MNILSNL